MIASLKGTVELITGSSVELDVGGVGYSVMVPSSVVAQLQVGRKAKLLTHLAVKEDSMSLYGFLAASDRFVFQSLISVTGVGPKLALAVLSSIGSDGLTRAVSSQDVALLTDVPGVGKRGAQRILLELKDKLGSATSEADTAGSKLGEVRDALVSLGYSSSELRDVLDALDEDETVEELVKRALKGLARV